MVRVFVSESESLQCMIIKTQIYQCSPPPWMQNQTFKNERVFWNNALTNKFCWDILLHVNEKSKNNVEKDKKNLSIFNEVLANNISQSTAWRMRKRYHLLFPPPLLPWRIHLLYKQF